MSTRKLFELFKVLGVTVFAALAVGGCKDSDSGQCSKMPGPNQDEIVAFVNAGCFKDMARDPVIRSSGPLVLRGDKKLDQSTHNRVRVYYSSSMVDWMKNGRPAGKLPDGAVMIKQMFPSDTTMPDADVPLGYATMVRDSKGSVDGWFWSSYITLADDPRKPIGKAGWSDCLICHSSANNPENTFAALEHLDGTLREPQEFIPDDQPLPPEPPPKLKLPEPLADPDPAFVGVFTQNLQPADPMALAFPSQLPNDHAPAKLPMPDKFLTSDICSGCHSARISNITGRNLVATDAENRNRNTSPFGEWSASLMGLAGRDPVFHAQLESEKMLRPSQVEYLDNTCYKCHGPMGLRQLALDKQQPFKHEMVFATGDNPDAKYGALARDGVSCTVCHRITAENLGTEASFTGNFSVAPGNEVFGPYDDVKPYPMKTGLALEPQKGAQIASAALCGSCHSVILPRLPLGAGPDAYKDPTVEKGHEQATYLEWRNSIYQNETQPISTADVRTCQDCHMPRKYDDQTLDSRIANIEDFRYPAVPNRAADDSITLTERDGYSRHKLVGANQFTLRMFAQFSDLLGVSTYNPYGYNGTEIALVTAVEEGLKTAQFTAAVEVTSVTRTADKLQATVSVTNNAGHKFPSGVNFRRAFLELLVLDANGKVLWGSGRTNAAGEILDGAGKVLDTEMSRTAFQPHYDTIRQQDQVQIYEERNSNEQHELTTSFLGLFNDLKDNRLLPKGWRLDYPNSLFMQPVGINNDPRYADGSGSDEIKYEIALADVPGAATVRATLYYQALPPYYLRDRFVTANGVETQRLYYLASRLATKDTPIANWKLQISTREGRL